ncbi:hypothetical protein AACM06_004463 [Escherichia coli]
MSLSERLAALLSTEEETPEEEGVEKAADPKPEKTVNTRSGSEGDKPKLVRKQITLGARPINVDLSKEVKRFNE